MVYDQRRADCDRRDRNDRNYIPQYQNREGFRGRDRDKDQDGDRDQEDDRERDTRDYGRNKSNFTRDPGQQFSKGPKSGRERPGTSEQMAGPSSLSLPKSDLFQDRQNTKTAPPTLSGANATIVPKLTSTTTPTATETWQQMIDLNSNRSYHCTMRMRAQKAHQKAQQSWERFRQNTNDFGSSVAFLEKQKKDTEDEKIKFDRLIKEDDEKLRAAFLSLWPNAGQSIVQNGSKRPSSTTSDGNSSPSGTELEAKFTSMGDSLEKRISEQVWKKVEEDMTSMHRKHKSELENQALRLQMDMASTTERHELSMSQLREKVESQALRNDALEERLKRLEEGKPLGQVGSQSPTHECASSKSNASDIQHLSELLGNHIGNANTRITQIERTMSQMKAQLQELADKMNELPPAEKVEAEEKQRQEFALLHDQWSKLPVQNLQTLPIEVSHNKTEMQGRLDKLSAELTNLKTQIDAVRESQSQSPAPSSSLDPRMDQRIVEAMINAQIERLKLEQTASLRDFAVRFGNYLNDERDIRAALQSRLEGNLQAQAQSQSQMQRQLEEKLSELQTAMNENNSNPSPAKDNFTEEQGKLNTQLSASIGHYGQKLIAIDNRLDLMDRSNRSWFESVNLSVHNLGHWQKNFDTRPLFRDIINHINATVPDQWSKAITALDKRVSGIDYRLSVYEEGSRKRRRLDGSAGPENDSGTR